MNKLIFVYDKLMTKTEQANANLSLEFISFAQINSKLYWLTDGKRKRLLLMPTKGLTTNLVYGGIFLLKDYENNRHKLHSYYNNSIPYTSMTMIEDLYDFVDVQVTPIKFSSLKCIEVNNYTKGELVECSSFIGNLSNRIVKYNTKRSYYKSKGVDKEHFITLVKENVNES